MTSLCDCPTVGHHQALALNIASGGRTFVIKREISALAAKGRKVTPAERKRIAEIAEREARAPAMDHLIWHDLRRTCGCCRTTS